MLTFILINTINGYFDNKLLKENEGFYLKLKEKI